MLSDRTEEMPDHGYDLAVAYRIYPKVSKPAETLPFGDDKLRQSEICLRSFRKSLGSLRVKVWAILDGCPPDYCALFERYFANADLVLIELDKAGNKPTFAKQIEILLDQQDAPFVYFAEDDYFYLPDQFSRMLNFLRGNESVDFISPYDHVDCYHLDLHNQPKLITLFEDHHWRTAASTCLTFLTRKSTLKKYQKVFRTYCRRGGDDCALWLAITKSRVFNPIAITKYVATRQSYAKAPLKSWLFCSHQILFGSSAKLWVPVPGIATHLSAGLLSPGTDWSSLMNIADQEITDAGQLISGTAGVP